MGTYQGYSATAMSSAKEVVSYDVENLRIKQRYPRNIKFKVGDVLEDNRLNDAELILLDTYHLGGFEKRFLAHLNKISFKGMLVMDDIHFSNDMERVWESIKLPKEDFTEYGHYTGTGIVYYNEQHSDNS